jgi:hypothetical protein
MTYISPFLESFPPLHVVVGYSWDDDTYAPAGAHPHSQADAGTHRLRLAPGTPGTSRLALATNTFQVPDFDDDEGDEDDDISFVQETVLKPKLEVAVPSSTRAQQEAIQHYIEDATSEMPGQGIIDFTRLTSRPPAPSFLPTAVPRLNDSPAHSSSPALRASVAASGPSGLTEAERLADEKAMKLNDLPTSSTDTSTSTDLQSPAKSNSSLPTSSQSKESDTHPNAKAKNGVNLQSSTRPGGSEKRAIVVDEDLTQSESGSDEACSPDLMVDDSEDDQGLDALSDYGSDSDEEALLKAQNHGTNLARVVEDSTDSESSRSEVSDDIGMDREEDFFDHSDDKSPGTKEVRTADIFDHFEKAPTAQEPVPYNMRPGNFTMPCTRLNLPAKPLNRAPSPSDAAMAKPCDFASGVASVPGGSYAYSNPQPWTNSMGAAYNSPWLCTFDTRTHAPYDERFGAFQSSDSFQTFPTHMAMIAEHGFTPEHSGVKPPGQFSGSPRLQAQPQPQVASISSGANMTPIGVARLPQDMLPSAAKVSINSIVEQASDERTSSHHATTLKRKAEEMFGDGIAGSASERVEQVTQAENTRSSGCPPQTKTVTVAQIKAMQNMPSVNSGEDERPAKRARLGKETAKSSFATLAATAIAGAVVGGVGVLAALVALPQDFFV